MLMAVFTLSPSFWVLVKGLSPSWSLEACSAPLKPSALAALPLYTSLPWFERPSKPLCTLYFTFALLAHSASYCSDSAEASPSLEALPGSPPVCSATRHPPGTLQRGAGLSHSNTACRVHWLSSCQTVSSSWWGTGFSPVSLVSRNTQWGFVE